MFYEDRECGSANKEQRRRDSIKSRSSAGSSCNSQGSRRREKRQDDSASQRRRNSAQYQASVTYEDMEYGKLDEALPIIHNRSSQRRRDSMKSRDSAVSAGSSCNSQESRREKRQDDKSSQRRRNSSQHQDSVTYEDMGYGTLEESLPSKQNRSSQRRRASMKTSNLGRSAQRRRNSMTSFATPSTSRVHGSRARESPFHGVGAYEGNMSSEQDTSSRRPRNSLTNCALVMNGGSNETSNCLTSRRKPSQHQSGPVEVKNSTNYGQSEGSREPSTSQSLLTTDEAIKAGQRILGDLYVVSNVANAECKRNAEQTKHAEERIKKGRTGGPSSSRRLTSHHVMRRRSSIS